jgi:hypothetical protein
MTHRNNSIALKFCEWSSFHCLKSAILQSLNLQYYNWRWLRPLELIEVEFGLGKAVFEVYKWERDEDKLIAVVVPIKQEVGV